MGAVITTIALTLILFEGGIDISFAALKRAAGPTSMIAFPTFFMSLIVGTVCFFAAWPLFLSDGVDPIQALVFGAIIAGTSSAVVIPLANQLKPHDSIKNALVLESAVTDVLCIVFAFAFLGVAQSAESFSIGKLIGGALSTLVFAAIIGFISGLVWILIWKSVIEMKASIFTTVAFALLVYGVAELLGFSGAISALVFGLTLANYKRLPKAILKPFGENLPTISSVERGLFGELVFLLKTFFFVFLGINMNFRDWKAQVLAFVLLLILYFFRRIWCRLSLRDQIYSDRDRAVAGILIPKGLAAAVLAGVPLQMGLSAGKAIESVTYAVVLQSIILSSVLIWFLDKKDQSIAAQTR